MATRAFSEIDTFSFNEQLVSKVKAEIEGRSKDYILGVDEDEYKKYLIDKFSIEPLIIHFDKEFIGEPRKSTEWVESWRRSGERYQAEVYSFTVQYPFTGDSVLFKVRPNPYALASEDITISDHSKTVSYTFKMQQLDPAEFRREKQQFHRQAFANYDSGNSIANAWNEKLKVIVGSLIQAQKTKYQKENDFFAAINVKVNENTISVFTAPTITKKVIPQPTVSKTKEFSSEPMMSTEMYNDALKVIYDSGKSMEKKPTLYQGKDEEGLRDQFLFVLETRYDSTTATGETFNRGGKTDIMLKYAKDGTNLFVAECKFWHGTSEFLKAISQLFDRYLTWRDSKAALMMFVTNKDFTNVLESVKTEIKKHEYYVKENGRRGESSLSYVFCLPQDKNKHVFLEVLLFHYDK